MDPYERIMSILHEPLTAQQVAGKLKINSGAHIAMLKRLFDAGAISRCRHEFFTRVYVYQRIENTITAEEVKQRLQKIEDDLIVKPSNARIVSFDSPEMQEKLKQSNRLSRRKAEKVHIGASWNFD